MIIRVCRSLSNLFIRSMLSYSDDFTGLSTYKLYFLDDFTGLSTYKLYAYLR
jgi:hypothetical protein